jgi:hypothetical protein
MTTPLTREEFLGYAATHDGVGLAEESLVPTPRLLALLAERDTLLAAVAAATEAGDELEAEVARLTRELKVADAWKTHGEYERHLEAARDRAAAEVAVLREALAQAERFTRAIYSHYSEEEAAKAGPGSQLHHQRSALAIMRAALATPTQNEPAASGEEET